ncbi:MAG: tetratricopeptide repeat protein [Saprospiraceae bacterium]|nr:tetratricopeptide repeat protein [Saprospiraceae bacterium]
MKDNLLRGTAGSIFLLIVLTLVMLPACQSSVTKNTPTDQDLADSIAFENYRAMAKRFNQEGDSLRASGDYPAAMARYQMSMDSAAFVGDSFAYYDSRLDLALVYERLRNPARAIELAEPTIEAYIRSGDSVRIGRGYSTLAGFYGQAGLQEKSLEAARKGFEILRSQGDLIHRCAAFNQMAFVYSDAGQWAEALPLLDSALLLMQASGVLDQLPSMYLNIGNCHRKLEHWTEARQYLNLAEKEAARNAQRHVRAVALDRLSQLAESTGDNAGALKLYRQSVALKDTIFREENAASLRELETSYATKEKEQQYLVLQAEYEAELNRRNMILILMLVGAAGFTLLGLRWRQKLKRSRLKLERNQKNLQEFAQLLLAKNTRLTELEETLGAREKSAELPAAQATESESAEQPEGWYNSRILTDSDWELFKNYFERGNPGYLYRLRTQFPKLSSAEERLLLLIKLNFTSQEAAATLGISKESIKKGRQRLRKRLGLNPDQDLELFIRQF